jgi:hypothetical protein
MKTKEINFERVRVGKPESSCEPSVGSAGGMEFGGDVQTPGLVARRTWAKGVRPLHGYKMKTKECKRLAGDPLPLEGEVR